MVIVKKDDYINHLEYKKWTIKWTQIHCLLEENGLNFDKWINFDNYPGWTHLKVWQDNPFPLKRKDIFILLTFDKIDIIICH